MRHFCTYFDKNYLVNGITLYKSLEKYAGDFKLWVLCFDEISFLSLRKLAFPAMELIKISDVECWDDRLLKVKPDRKKAEYFFTSSPFLPSYLFENHKEIDIITYLDADLMFFSDPEPVFKEFEKASIMILRHRFPCWCRHMEIYGIYNLSFLSIRRDKSGIECLEWWKDRCIEWCYDRVEDGKFGDQKYMDDWLTRFQGVVEVKNIGAGLAPWNAGMYSLRSRDGKIYVNSNPLIFYHFHGLRQIKPWLYDPRLARFRSHRDNILKREIYGKYLSEINGALCFLSNVVTGEETKVNMGAIRYGEKEPVKSQDWIFMVFLGSIQLFQMLIKILKGHFWIYKNGKIW